MALITPRFTPLNRCSIAAPKLVLISRSSMDRELESMGHEARAGDLLFESWHDPAAMAHITCGYALKLGAERGPHRGLRRVYLGASRVPGAT